jgi:hypothetical protein
LPPASTRQSWCVRLPGRCRRIVGRRGHSSFFPSQPCHRDACRSLCWHSCRGAPTGITPRPTRRGAHPPKCSKHSGNGGSRQAGPVSPVYEPDKLIDTLKGAGRRAEPGEWRTRFATKPSDEVTGPRSIGVRVRTAAENDMVLCRGYRCRKKTAFKQRCAA